MSETTNRTSETTKILLSNTVTLVIALVSSYVMYAGNSGKNDVQREKVLYERIAVLEERVAFLTQEMIKKDLELAKRYDNLERYKRSLDRMPFPVAVKLEKGVGTNSIIVNWHVNTEYQNRYSVTQAHYYGRADAEIWPQEIAAQFEINDRKILQFKNSDCPEEIYPAKALQPEGPDNHLMQGTVCKWYDEIAGFKAVIAAVIHENRYVKPEVN